MEQNMQYLYTEHNKMLAEEKSKVMRGDAEFATFVNWRVNIIKMPAPKSTEPTQIQQGSVGFVDMNKLI